MKQGYFHCSWHNHFSLWHIKIENVQNSVLSRIRHLRGSKMFFGLVLFSNQSIGH